MKREDKPLVLPMVCERWSTDDQSTDKTSDPKLWKRVKESAERVAKWPKWKLGSRKNERGGTHE